MELYQSRIVEYENIFQMGIKYSIVIPHWHNFLDLLKPCLESIIRNTSKERLLETEIIVVANGSKDVGRLRSEFNFVKVIEYPEAVGYTRATNAGIKEAKGEFVILMNDDCVILDYAANDEWMDILEKPFEDETVGVTGVKKIYSQQAKQSFLVFFLVMIRRSIFDVVGYLDESFSPGGGEDIDFCLRLKKFGLRGVKAPHDDENYEYGTEYPVWHAGEKSVHDVDGWEDGFWKRMAVIEQRVNSFQYENYADVTAYVSTKGRYTTTLPGCLTAIANQTLKPKSIIIFQDDHQDFNMQESSVYRNILYGLFQQKGIEWSVVYGEGKGQVLNHQKAIDIAKTEWLWRVDDDNVPEPNVLEGLCKHIDHKVGAVASAVIDPLYTPSKETIISTEIKYINISPNFQWLKSNSVVSADHLYSTFLVRKAAAAHGYNKDLSVVGHREETLFTHEMKRNGWDLIIDTNLVTWHLRESTGGIRSFSDGNLWGHDEGIFNKKMAEWGIKLAGRVLVNLDAGIGDHWMFKSVLEMLLNKNVHDMIIVAACYPAVFEDLKKKYGNLNIISIADGNNMFGKDQMDKQNIYRWCIENNWTGHIQLAMEKLYLNK
jgi:glycosyltransferase involved in cell wall biosynthesis